MSSPAEKSESRHWAQISEQGTVVGMQILLFAYKLGGRPLFKLFLFPVICFYFLLRVDSRKASRDYLLRVNARSGRFRKVNGALVFRHFWQFGVALIDKFAVWMGDIQYHQLRVHNSSLIDELIAQGRGCIFAVSHLGNFEVISAMSRMHKGVKLTVLLHTRHAEKFNKLLNKYAQGNDVELLQVSELSLATATLLSERVDNGEFVAIACDRVPINNREGTVACKFLGGSALFPQGPYVLSQILTVPLVMVLCLYEKEQYCVYFELLDSGEKLPRSERQRFIQKTAQKNAKLLECHAIKEPLQWFNFYDFWHDGY